MVFLTGNAPRYSGFSHEQALQLAAGALPLIQKCSIATSSLFGEEDGMVENVRLKCAGFELICSQVNLGYPFCLL